jgi:hypothetical protein
MKQGEAKPTLRNEANGRFGNGRRLAQKKKSRVSGEKKSKLFGTA